MGTKFTKTNISVFCNKRQIPVLIEKRDIRIESANRGIVVRQQPYSRTCLKQCNEKSCMYYKGIKQGEDNIDTKIW